MKKRLLSIAAVLFVFALGCKQGGSFGGKGVSSEVRTVKIDAKHPAKAVAVVGGDTMLDDLALPYILAYGYGYVMQDLSKVFASADIGIVNLETVVADRCKRENKRYSYFMKPEGLIALKNAGVNAVTLANNHIMDCGTEGLKATLQNLQKAGVEQVGAGLDRKQAHSSLVFDVSGVKIGFGSFYDYGRSDKPEGYAMISEETVVGVMRILAAKSDAAAAVFHWGTNYKSNVDKNQKKFAEIAVKAGADIVIGHHPHIAQAAAMIDGKPVIYSLGNCAFGTGNNAVKSAMLCRFSASKKGLDFVELLPIATQNRNPQVLWRTKVLAGKEAEEMMKPIISKSKSMDAKIADAGDGVYRLEL